MTRKRFSEKQVIMTLACQGVVVPCYRCKEPLIDFNTNEPTVAWRIEREHVIELALGGGDVPANCRYSHTQCHHVVTNGTKATSAGSSKQRIAKVKRIVRGPKPSKHPMRGRGFDRKFRRKMNGKAELREPT